MAYIVMASIVMAYTIVAYIIMAYIVIEHVGRLLPLAHEQRLHQVTSYGLHSRGLSNYVLYSYLGIGRRRAPKSCQKNRLGARRYGWSSSLWILITCLITSISCVATG